MQEDTKPHYTDHDLLIRIDERTQSLSREMIALRDTTKLDILNLQKDKLSNSDFQERVSDTDKLFHAISVRLDTQDKKVEILTRAYWVGLTLLAVFEFAAPFIISHFNK